MRLSQIAAVSPSAPVVALPLRLTQTTSRGALLGHAACLSAAVTGLGLPLVAFAAEASAAPAAVGTFFEDRMGPLFLVLLAMSLLAALGWWSGSRMLAGLFPRQTIEISSDTVRCLGGRRSAGSGWWLPLQSYEGVTHHTRTTLSRPREELILVHRKPAKSVLLRFDDSITEAELATTAKILGLPVVPPARLYGL